MRRRYLQHRDRPVRARTCERPARIQQMRNAVVAALSEHLQENEAGRTSGESRVQATFLLAGIKPGWPGIEPILKLNDKLEAAARCGL